MGADYQSTWDKIQAGIRETERLIGQKQYNLSMIKARQTLEIMIRCLGEKACIIDSDMADSIDQLYESRWISKATMEHYHKIRTIGNKAVHENDNSPYNANQAYHMLSQEVYTFANDYSQGRRKAPAAKNSSSRSASGKSASAERSSASRRTPSSGRSSSSARPAGSGRSSSSGAHRRKSKKKGASYESLIRFAIPVVCIILLIILIKILMPVFPLGKDKQNQDTSAPAAVETVENTETAPPETPAPTEPETQAVTYKTNTTLNVRTEPNTSCSIVTQLPPGTAVQYVGQYDDSWTIINYDGQDVYVSSQYLTAE